MLAPSQAKILQSRHIVFGVQAALSKKEVQVRRINT
jgi:hypothetical protein